MFVFVLFSITLYPFKFCNHIEEEEKVVCCCRLLKCYRTIYDKQCGPRSDYRSNLIKIQDVCFYAVMFCNYSQQMTSVDDLFGCKVLSAIEQIYFGALLIHA